MNSTAPTTAVRNPNHMDVSGSDWEQWKARVWNQLADQFGYPGLAPLEQWMWRSASEKRCIECGDPGTVKHERTRVSVVQSVPLYWMCADCAEYWRTKG